MQATLRAGQVAPSASCLRRSKPAFTGARSTAPRAVASSVRCSAIGVSSVISQMQLVASSRGSRAAVQQERMACRASRREGVFLFGFGGNNQDDSDDDYDEDFTVCKLQVGLFGDINKWQTRLNSIATKYDTDDEEGLHMVFTDSLMMVLRNLEYAGYATSAGKVFTGVEKAEQKFNSVLLEERLKFKEETLVNVDGKRKTRTLDVKGTGDGLDQWLCMTLLMCVEGKVKIPKVNSSTELKQVLVTLGGLSADNLVAFELLWTPQESDDWYTKQELLTDYPTMITLS